MQTPGIIYLSPRRYLFDKFIKNWYSVLPHCERSDIIMLDGCSARAEIIIPATTSINHLIIMKQFNVTHVIMNIVHVDSYKLQHVVS